LDLLWEIGMKSNRGGEIDEILNAALSSYSMESPRPGLEQRVLNCVKYEGRHFRKSWLRPASVMVASACLLLAVISIPEIWRPAPPRSGAVPSAKLVQTSPPLPATVHLKKIEPLKLSRKREQPNAEKLVRRERRLPKLDLFPSPTPLTSEEHVLLVLATYSPQNVPKSLLKSGRAAEQPIQIEPIKIEPL
jgi:hypothetical protein